MPKIIKGLSLICLCLILLSCQLNKIPDSINNWKDSTLEKVKARLSALPFVSRFINLPPPPKGLYNETEKKMALLNVSQARDLYPQEYASVSKKWEKAKDYYKKRYYRSAERLLKEVNKTAEELLNQVEDYNRNLRERALLKYKERERTLLERPPGGEREMVKVRLYLWRLKNLIELGKYDEFEKELESSPLK